MSDPWPTVRCMDDHPGGAVTAVLIALSAAVHGYLDAVATGELNRVSDADVLTELRELEATRRRLAFVDSALISELERRGLAGRLVMGSTAALLQGLLRISPGEAKDRVKAAHACGPRTTRTGEKLPALVPALAAAQADGSVSNEHTRVILSALQRLPLSASIEDHQLVEKLLVEAAITLRPQEVAAVGRRILAHLAPDGSLAPEAEQLRHRSFALHLEADGTYTARGRLTASCGGAAAGMPYTPFGAAADGSGRPGSAYPRPAAA